jgi:hypothetical protein
MPTPCARGVDRSGEAADEADTGAEGVVDGPDIDGNGAIVHNGEPRRKMEKVQNGYLDRTVVPRIYNR